MPWATVAAIAAPIVIGQLTGSGKKRSSSSEVPGMSEYIGQSLAGQRNAQMFSEAAVNPNSDWFKNLAGLFREGEEEAAMRGLNLSDFRERQAMGRGGNVIGERRDEARIGALMDAFRRAQISSRNSAHGALMNAAKGEAATMGDPNASFKILQQFGQAEQDRKQSQTDLFGQLFNGALGAIGGGGGSNLSGISGGVNPTTGYFNQGYYGLF